MTGPFHEQKETSLQALIDQKVSRILTPLESFIREQADAGILLALAILLALLIANSPWNNLIVTVSNMELGIYLEQWAFSLTIVQWIGDGLLALFFFLVGLEIKREMLIGQLRNPKQASLVIIAAIGGMIIPALIYWIFNHGGPGHSGWAIPMTTDTAFAIGVMALLARHVSIDASIFLTALAIIDDIGTIAVIAIFYTHDFDSVALYKALIPLGLLFTCNLLGIRHGSIYIILGIILWWYIHESGIHATLAGLLMALAVPARPRIGQLHFIAKIKNQISNFEDKKMPGQTMLESSSQHQLAADMGSTVKDASTPLQQWHSILVSPTAVIVLPLFAVFNAGIQLSHQSISDALVSPVSLGIIIGLVIGKPLGITLFSLLALRLQIARMPDGMHFAELIGAGILAGIGFTMSLFITIIGFEHHPDLIEPAKIGILISSIIATTLGAIWFLLFHISQGVR